MILQIENYVYKHSKKAGKRKTKYKIPKSYRESRKEKYKIPKSKKIHKERRAGQMCESRQRNK